MVPTGSRRFVPIVRLTLPSLLQSLLTAAVYAVFRRFDLVGDVSVAMFTAIIMTASVVNQFWGVTRERWGDRTWWLHGSLIANTAATTTVMYATGWGAPLVVVGYLVSLSERGRTHPLTTWRPGLGYALAGTAFGQLAVELGIAPTEIDTPGVHGLAGLSALGLAFVVHQFDITTRQRERAREALERSEERFRALVQNAPDIVVVSDADGNVTYASPSVVQTGFTAELLTGTTAYDLLHPDDLQAAAQAQLDLLERPGGMTQVELRARDPDGSWRWYEVTSQNRLDDPAVEGIVSNVRDITERKRAADALSEHARRLEETNAELVEAQAVKDEFVATVSHELRTPLTTIIGFSETLQRHGGSLDDEEANEFVATISRQSRRLARMVEDLLVLSKVAHGTVTANPEDVDLGPIVRETVDALQAEGGGVITVEVPPRTMATVDVHHLQRIVENLVTNARRYGKPPIVIDARVEDPSVVLSVTDNGPGIPEEFAPQAFEKFSRRNSDVAGTSGHGLGLGLAIVNLLAEANAGRAWYDPPESGGARFSVALPAASTDGHRRDVDLRSVEIG